MLCFVLRNYKVGRPTLEELKHHVVTQVRVENRCPKETALLRGIETKLCRKKVYVFLLVRKGRLPSEGLSGLTKHNVKNGLKKRSKSKKSGRPAAFAI